MPRPESGRPCAARATRVARRSSRTRRSDQRPLHFDDDRLAGHQRGRVNLRDRRGRERHRREGREHFVERTTQLGFHDRAHIGKRLRGDLIAELLELADELLREQAVATRNDLAQLDVGGSETFEAPAQPGGDSRTRTAGSPAPGRTRPRAPIRPTRRRETPRRSGGNRGGVVRRPSPPRVRARTPSRPRRQVRSSKSTIHGGVELKAPSARSDGKSLMAGR